MISLKLQKLGIEIARTAQDVPGFGIGNLAPLGESESPSPAFADPIAERRFQIADSDADRRLGDTKRKLGIGETATIDHGHKCLKKRISEQFQRSDLL